MGEIEQIKREHVEKLLSISVVMIVESADGFEVHQWTSDSVMPVRKYDTARLAASRVLQLLKTGPVAPQMHPEVAEIGRLTVKQQDTPNG